MALSSQTPVKTRNGWGEWWYRWTTPTLPQNPTFAQREKVRRARQASLTTILITLYSLTPTGQAIFAGNFQIIVIVIVNVLINGLVLILLNRKGHLIASGVIILTLMFLGFLLGFLTFPGGISINELRAFDLLAASLMVTVAFFPPRTIFIVMGVNILFTIFWILFGPHQAELAPLLLQPYTLLFPPIAINIFEAVLTFIWVSSALKAITDLDRSEEIVEMERREIAQQEEQLILKQQLESGVEQLLQTHVKAANGDFSARVPLSKDNILWKVAYSLNNLLSRLERYNQLETEAVRTQEALHTLAQQIRKAKDTGLPIQFSRTGTAVDEVIVELSMGNVSRLQQHKADSDKSALPQPAAWKPFPRR